MPSTTVATASSPRGEVVLRRRHDDGALELRVNGVFVMDSAETTSETGLAHLALTKLSEVESDVAAPDRTRILVGGLGLGFTLRRLAASDQVHEIVVVEIEGALIDWHRHGLIPATAQIVDDPRITFVEGDVRAVVEAMPPGTLDGMILDVDNGPGFLVYDDNAAVYQASFLSTCYRALRERGLLVVWSSDDAPELDDVLRRTFGSVDHHATRVTLGSRDERYHTYVTVKAPDQRPACPAL